MNSKTSSKINADSLEDFREKEAAKAALLALLPEVEKLFESEPAVIRVDSGRMMLIGDLHGNLATLEFVLKMNEKLGCETLLFLGDYVDRGPRAVEVLLKLFRLKTATPEKIFLLRGNHETPEMNLYYGFYEEINCDSAFLLRITRAFEKMPIAAVVSKNTFCVHGGIPGPVALEEIKKEEAFSYLWNDPTEKPGISPSFRGFEVREFGPDVVDEFLQSNNLKRIIRGHTALKDGYEWWFEKKLLSLFSCPDYVGLGNLGAFAVLETSGPEGTEKITIYQFSSAQIQD